MMATGIGPPWNHVRLDEVAVRGSGHTPDKKHPEYWDGDILWISLKDTFRLDRRTVTSTTDTISAEGLAHSSAVLHPRGTVILLRDAGIGKSGIMGADMAVSQHFMAWRCGAKLDNWFLYYYLQRMKPEFERISNGSTIKTIGLDYFKQFTVPLPSIVEQRSISLTLREADDLIAALERLIDKKQAIKQGMIQQLLTGRTRLPGFTEPWVSAQFGDLAAPARERVLPRSVDQNTTLVELEHIDGGSGRLIGSSEVGDAISLKTIFRTGDVLFGKLRAYLRKFWLADGDGLCSTEIWALRARPGVASGFIRYVVETDRFIEVASGGYGTHMPRSDWGVVRNLEIALPPLDEQEAISNVLHDADSEIRALLDRLIKARAIKTGMMQRLLTGRTRLPMQASS